LIRQPNENLANQPHYISQGGYPFTPATPTMQSTPPMYQQQFFPCNLFFSSIKIAESTFHLLANYQLQPNYGPIPTQPMPNPQVPPQQAQYSIPPGASQPTQIYQTQQPTQHQPVVRLFDFSSLRNFDF
jgi:hypothetical protein